MPPLFRKPLQKVRPYEKLARVYDIIMSHVNYRRWARYIVRLCKWAEISDTSILDISCGTGSLGLELYKLGYKPYLFDASHAMVYRARKRLQEKSILAPIWVNDMQLFSLRNKFYIIVCIYDSMNYLLSAEEWNSALSCVSNTLRNRGLFIFDVCTKLNSVKNFKNYRDEESGPGFTYKRHSKYFEKENVQVNEFWLSFSDNPNKVYYESHTQKIYLLDEVREFVQRSGLIIRGIFNDFTMHPGSEDSERVHFVLQKMT